MDIQGIRNVFSKASIIVDDKISAMYTFKDGWITQSIDNGHKRVLAELIDESEYVIISYKAGKNVKLAFQYPHLTTGANSVYPPIVRELSTAEKEEMLKESQESVNEEFVDFFVDADLSDDNAILERLGEWIELKNKSEKGNSVFLANTRGWQEFLDLCLLFANMFACETEVTEPSHDFAGCVEVRFPEGITKPFRIIGERKRVLSGLMERISEMDIECSVNDGYFTMAFYA